MKKSQLRKIIRESIKGLMNEQLGVTWGPGIYKDSTLFDCSIVTTGPVEGIRTGNMSNDPILFAPKGMTGPGSNATPLDCIKVEWNGAPLDCTWGSNSTFGSSACMGTMPMMVEYQGTLYMLNYGSTTNSMTLGQCPSPPVGVATVVNGQFGHPIHTGINGPSCPVPNGITWQCKNKGNHPKFGKHCVETTSGYGFTTKQDCIASGCEPLKPDTNKDLTAVTPLTGPAPQPKIAQPDDEMQRMQDLANIK